VEDAGEDEAWFEVPGPCLRRARGSPATPAGPRATNEHPHTRRNQGERDTSDYVPSRDALDPLAREVAHRDRPPERESDREQRGNPEGLER
jgi:hypothetical protein